MKSDAMTWAELREKYLQRAPARRKKYERIQQQNYKGCAIACLAMAAGVSYDEMFRVVEVYFDAIRPRDGYDGMNDEDERQILLHFGFRMMPVRRFGDGLRAYVGNNPAILCVPSINMPTYNHAVFWTGRELHDPSPYKKYSAEAAWKVAIYANIITPVDLKARLALRGIDGVMT
jgi:hypothetical protein